MKKLSFFLMAMLMSVMSFAATETISCPAGTVVSSKITMDFKSLTFLQEQGSSTSPVKAYSPWRIYKNHKVTFTPQTDVTIENLVITCTASDYAKNGTLTNATATLSGTTLTITPTDGTQAFTFAATVAQVRWQKIVVTYKVAGEVVAVEAPKFDVTTSNFTEAFSLNITSAEGTTLKYTTDTTDPATSATAVVINTNTATVAIPAKSTMVRAIAIKGEDVSEEKETTYCYVNSPATAYTVAEAMEVIDAGLGLTNELYVKGEISTIEKYDANYGSITYWIEDEEGNKFECYSGLGLNKAKFTKKEDLVVGSKVVVCGVMKKYNTTYEFNYNNYIVSLELPVAKYTVTATAENGTVEGAGEYIENAEVTLTATAAEGYEFTCWTSGEDTVSTENPYTFVVTADLALVANFNKKAEPEHTYTVAGSSATVFGEPWKADNADNDMTKQEDGTYKLEKTELTLAAGTIEFKVCQDHAWTVAYPGDNYKLTIAEDGIYTITITFNPADEVVAATATKTGDVGKIIPTIAMHGNFLGEWKDTENFTLAADEATATLTLTIAEGNYEFGVRIDGTWTSNGVAFTRENASAEIVAGSGNLTLAADVAGEYTFTWTYATNTLTVTYPVVSEPTYEVYEVEIKDLVIDYDNLVLSGSANDPFQVAVTLGLGEYNRNDDTYQLIPESYVELNGSGATFVEGYASVNGFDQTATAVVRCVWSGMNIELHLNMSSAPIEAIVVVVENATAMVEKVHLFGDMYDYALKITGEWINPEDGLTYPVLVEVPVYYPEATEPSEIMSTVTVGGSGDNDPWLGFGEGTLTITTVGDVVTATGVVQNPMAGVAIDITISGTIVTTDLDGVTVTAKPVKMIQNGQLIIIKNGVEYNAQGAQL